MQLREDRAARARLPPVLKKQKKQYTRRYCNERAKAARKIKLLIIHCPDGKMCFAAFQMDVF